MRFLLLFLLLNSSIAMGQSLPADPLPPDESTVLYSFGEEMLQRINTLRVNEGLPLLWKSEAAICAATIHGAYIVEKETCNHAGSSLLPTSRERLRICGQPNIAHTEALACGYNTASSALDGWMESPRHAQAILSDDYSQFGAGFKDGKWVLVLLQ